MKQRGNETPANPIVKKEGERLGQPRNGPSNSAPPPKPK